MGPICFLCHVYSRSSACYAISDSLSEDKCSVKNFVIRNANIARSVCVHVYL